MQDFLSLQDIVDELDVPRARVGGLRRIVVAGEFEAGKSSVINVLLRQQLLPCNPGMVARPLVKIRHAPQQKIAAEDAVGRPYEPSSLEEISSVRNLSTCDIRTPAMPMKDVEVVEVPFRHGVGIEQQDFEVMIDADLIIWVTIASQAWRLSEKAIIEKLPSGARDRSILAISRADKLRSGNDLDKIEARLQKEAANFFSEIVFIQASTTNIGNIVNDVGVWEQTGGAALASIADDILTAGGQEATS